MSMEHPTPWLQAERVELDRAVECTGGAPEGMRARMGRWGVYAGTAVLLGALLVSAESALEHFIAISLTLLGAGGLIAWSDQRPGSVRTRSLEDADCQILSHACLAEQAAQQACRELATCAPQLGDPSAPGVLAGRLREIASLCAESTRLLRGATRAEPEVAEEAFLASHDARRLAWGGVEGMYAIAREARELTAQIESREAVLGEEEILVRATALRERIETPRVDAHEEAERLDAVSAALEELDPPGSTPGGEVQRAQG